MNNAVPDSAAYQYPFQAQQAEFCAYVRNPAHCAPPPKIKPERMVMYAELLFNNIESFIASNFPVLKTITPSVQWQQLVRDFYVEHHSQSPYFSDIPSAFLHYLQYERNNPQDFPFLLELAHYEWVEMALSISQEELAINASGDQLSAHSIALSPLAWLLAYQYPVQQISPDYLPEAPPAQATLLIVHRDQKDQVKFIVLNPVSYQLLTLIQEQPGLIAHDYLNQLAETIKLEKNEVFMQGGLHILSELADKHIITLL